MSNVRSLTVRGLGLCALVLGTSATGCLACDASQPAATLRPVLRSDHEGILKNLSIRDVAPMEETIARDTAHAVEQVEAVRPIPAAPTIVTNIQACNLFYSAYKRRQ